MKSLLELYGEHQGKVSDKWSIYLAEYDRLFSGFREQPVRMLEIGIQNGGSLEIWSKYFPNAQVLVGCDINPDCAKLVYDDSRIQLVIGDANTAAVENEILSHSANFDLVIDDGSHTSSDIAKSFARYFRRLNEGGLFVAEDLHCSYWREFEGGLYYPYSSMAFFKRLADVVNHEHWGIAKERRQLLRGFSEKFSIEFDEGELADIHSIEFFNSVCVVRKFQAGLNVLGERFIAGQHEFVVQGLHRLSVPTQAPSQASNSWTAMIPAPEEAWQQLSGELSDRDSQISSLNQAVAERDSVVLALHELIAERDSQLHRLVASSSWRVTRPLRYIRRQLANRPTHRVWSLIRNSVAIARSQIRQHGLVGFVRRFPYYRRNVKSRLHLITQGTMSVDAELFSSVAPALSEVQLHPELTERGPMVEAFVSVVVPTLNAGHEFPWLLQKLRAQKNIRRIEMVIVDSGSSDDTVAIARGAGCTVVEIAPADFSHSYARNKGADAASGDHLLFMVQDAYPIGDFWLYGMLRYLQDHGDDKLVAVSCAEYCRSDSDIMYDSMVHTHYRFLGCLEYDRIGEFRGDDHMALRSQGQLSDVSCLISREVFARYRYRGDYAEDLDLGIRIIKDGLRVAMLASVKVIHSHNRPAYYYLKRSFVDVIFLVGLFPDFSYPKVEAQRGLLAGIASVAGYLSDWKASGGILSCHHKTVAEALGALTEEWRRGFVQVRVDVASNTGDAKLDAYVNSLKIRFLDGQDVSLTHAERQDSTRFLDVFLARLDHFKAFVAEVYQVHDGVLARELDEAVIKTFAAAAGSALAFMYLDFSKSGLGDPDMNNTLYCELKAGI